MKKYREIILVFILSVIVSCSSGVDKSKHVVVEKTDSYQHIFLDVDQAERNRQRQIRSFVLPNQLEVMLISDSDAEKSSAAMNVMVGGVLDPKEHLGIAHFLEHILFLGSKKYPKVDEYSKFIESHGGYSNAATDVDNTEYFFVVNHEAFEGALDRFAPFFVAPLFDGNYIERERKAVHSEYQKNIQNDYWREETILRLLMRQNSPLHDFVGGNEETLKNVTRDEMVRFYQKNYSANLMKLVLKSNKPLDKMEAWAREKFSNIPNKNIKKKNYGYDIFDFSKGTPFAEIKPVQDKQVLQLFFAAPPFYSDLDSKAHDFVAMLLGHEGKGSLLSLLKKKNLVSGLSSYLGYYSFEGLFVCEFELTRLGIENVDDVISLFYSYVNMIKQQGLKQWLFDEYKKIAEINFFFEVPHKGDDDVTTNARWMHFVKSKDINKKRNLYYQKSDKAFEKAMSFLKPENMVALLIYPGAKTNQKEPYYGVEYSITHLAVKKIQQWKNVPVQDTLSYPLQNQFLPSQMELLKNDHQTVPYKIIDDERGVIWFMQDKEVKSPKAILSFLILSDKINEDPRARLMSILYEKALYLSHVEWAYPMRDAGIEYKIKRSSRGIEFYLSGYSDKLLFVAHELIERLKTITIDDVLFKSLKDEVQRELDGWFYSLAHHQGNYHLAQILYKNEIHHDLYPSVNEITLEEIKNYAQSIYENIAVEGVSYGNLNAADVKELISFLYDSTGANVLQKDKRIDDDVLALKPGSDVYYQPKTKSDNNVWIMSVLLGPRNDFYKAYTLLGAKYFGTDFYTEMRSKRQLGYTVYHAIDFFKKAIGVRFVIQSGNYDPVDLSEQALSWIRDKVEKMDQMDDQLFVTYQSSLIEELKEELETMSEWESFISTAAFAENGNYHYKQDLIETIKKCSKQEMKEVFKKALDKKMQAVISIYLGADGTRFPEPKHGTKIDSIEKFKKGQDVY